MTNQSTRNRVNKEGLAMNEQLDEILGSIKYSTIDGMIPLDPFYTAEAKAKLQRLIVEAKHGIVINALNLLNTEPIHTVEQALLFDEERLTKELER